LWCGPFNLSSGEKLATHLNDGVMPHVFPSSADTLAVTEPLKGPASVVTGTLEARHRNPQGRSK
jgi:hypothetical protein